MQINKVGVIGTPFEAGNASRVRMVVMHSTAGRAPGDYKWLRQGGGPGKRVSIHYYIDKAGNISQMVDDEKIAWQAGASTWTVDGKFISPSCNPVSVGIELENLNTGRDPYPPAQYNAALELVRYLVSKYNIPRKQLVRHLDIAPRRKTDPAGFPWERFVAEVYGAGPAPTPPPAAPPVPAPQPQPIQASAQLRTLLVDLAYRAAGGARPVGWPLLKEAISKATGMPIAVITPPAEGDGQGEDDQQRTVVVNGQPLILEAYGRDLFYAAPETPEQVQRLSATPAGPLRDALLQTLFRSVDPVKGFRPDQAFHQFFLNHMTEIGVPIGPDHVLPGGKVSCQHYALDTLIWTGKVTRLSDLARAMYEGDPHPPAEKELRTQVLNDLYSARTGRAFDPNALFCRYAIKHGMGAPMGKAEIQLLEGRRLVAMPFALDVLYCQIPADGDWSKIVIGELPAVLGDEAEPSQLSELLKQGDVDADGAMVLGDEDDLDEVLPGTIFTGGVLGVESAAPAIADLSQSVGAAGERGAEIDLVVVYASPGPAGQDLAAAADPSGRLYHYYVDTTGAVVKLADEAVPPRAAGDAAWQGRGDVDARSVAIGVEWGGALGEAQATALAWLLSDLRERYSLVRGQFIQGADLGAGERLPDWEQLVGELYQVSMKAYFLSC
jgi:N-acetyl-anhydromuramyl-L-alanine amidase AmpD